MSDQYSGHDVIIIGGGPAGLSTAFWCAELGLRPVLFEKESQFGGQLLWTFNKISNYLGVGPISGSDLRDKFLINLGNRRIQLESASPVASVDLGNKTLVLDDNRQFSAKAIVIATGVRRRKLNVPGESEFQGRGILESGVKAGQDVAGKKVLIVGGGDAALENALILSKSAEKVIVVHRRDQFTARHEFVNGLVEMKNIEVFFDTCLTKIFGGDKVEGVNINNILTGTNSTVPADAVLIRVGVEPNTSLFIGQIEADADGYLLVDRDHQTSLQGVFAVADVTNPVSLTVSAAVAAGALVSRSVLNSDY